MVAFKFSVFETGDFIEFGPAARLWLEVDLEDQVRIQGRLVFISCSK